MRSKGWGASADVGVWRRFVFYWRRFVTGVIFLEFVSSSPTVETVGYENIVSNEIAKCWNKLYFLIYYFLFLICYS